MWRVVAAGVAFLAIGCAPSEPPAASVAPLPVRARRLSVREYVRSVRALTGVEVTHRFLEDSLDVGFDDGPVSLGVQVEQAEAYEQAAWEIASQTGRDRLIGSCDPGYDSAACRQIFFDGFVRRAVRRPLTDEEDARLQALFDLAASGPRGSFDEALQTVTAAILQSPLFLYRTEGAPRMSSYETASALSYLFTGLPPDDELLRAAGAGDLSAVEGIRAQARRLLAGDQARDQLGHFLDQWMATGQLGSVTKDPAFYDLDPVRSAMRADLDAFYQYVLFDSPGRSLDELFGSTVSFADSQLGPLYGLDVPAELGMAEVQLDGSSRRGVLTRAGFLAVHSGYDSSNPIVRGVFVRSAILCAPPPAPPPGIPRAPHDPPTMHTTRARYALHTDSPFCQSCHAAIDGVGFGFEQFDGLGALRLTENGEPVDTSGALIGTGDADGPFVGASELSDRLRKSRVVADCLARQLFRYSTGAAERPEDEPFLADFARKIDGRAPITELAIELVTSPMFARRSP